MNTLQLIALSLFALPSVMAIFFLILELRGKRRKIRYIGFDAGSKGGNNG